ncbi:hypothetical protein [Gimesia panareensis]|uniref:hypothetical protein n=1 Tax=Gimesia panareensis TaxID=2527978 RepID=UPI0011AAC0BA|nr:hypothetical protein [Gimesia panareensis]
MGIFTFIGLIVGILFILTGGFSKTGSATDFEPVRRNRNKPTNKKENQKSSKEPFFNQRAKSRNVEEGVICWVTGQPKKECRCSNCR